MNRLQNIQNNPVVTGSNGLSEFITPQQAAEFLRTHSDAEQIGIVVHKVNGRARFIGWIDGVPKPIGPEWQNHDEAEASLKNMAEKASAAGFKSIIKPIMAVDTLLEAKCEKQPGKLSDEEWLKQIPPEWNQNQNQNDNNFLN